MGKLEKMKERYDQITIPEELNVRVQQEIQKSRKQQDEKRYAGSRHRLKKVIRNMGAAAAAVCILFIAALNANPVFAKEAGQLPVIGGLARILTFRSYETETDDIAVAVEIPTIEMITEDTGITVDAVNQEILDRCSQYAKEAVLRAEEYRAAFLETGGTQQEWAEHKIQINVGYEIKQQSSEYLSFVVRGTESWTTAYSESEYYNLDLKTGEMVTLKDILGEDYVELADESIRGQIAERQKAGETFFAADAGGFTGISEDVKFYINENNRPVIVFEKYEIAPGSSGEPEFEIAKADETEKTAQASEKYEDNFAVGSGAAKKFAEKVKDAAAREDLEALAELAAFPVYVGLPDIGVVDTKEEFLNLGAETVFTDELLESVETADIESFNPCMAGFLISGGKTAGINFGVVNGALAINGINY